MKLDNELCQFKTFFNKCDTNCIANKGRDSNGYIICNRIYNAEINDAKMEYTIQCINYLTQCINILSKWMQESQNNLR